jgi:hypothetical protein
VTTTAPQPGGTYTVTTVETITVDRVQGGYVYDTQGRIHAVATGAGVTRTWRPAP